MSYLAYFGAAAVIIVSFLFRGTFLSMISASKGSYHADRRVEGGATIMLGSLVAAGWAVGFVEPNTVKLVMLAGLLTAGTGFVLLAVGVINEARQWT